VGRHSMLQRSSFFLEGAGASVARMVGVWLGSVVGLGVPSARAETLPFGEIAVRHAAGAESCPSERELVERTLSLGVARADAPPEPLRVEVSFERAGSDYVARIRSSGRKTGERELRESGPECRPLLDATAVVLSVLLDLLPPEQVAPEPTAAAPTPPAKPAPPPPPPPARPSEPARLPEKPPDSTPSWSWGGGVRLAGGAGYGLLGDAVSPWLSGGAFVHFLGVEASLEGLFVPERSIDYRGGVVHVALLGGMLEGCYDQDVQGISWLRAGACASFGLGALSASGTGFDDEGESTDLWMAAGVSLDGRAALTRALGVRAELSSLFFPIEQTLSVENVGEAFRSTNASVILSVGPELTIW
jgi:hypothetical protein